jgi:hypothetical protein
VINAEERQGIDVQKIPPQECEATDEADGFCTVPFTTPRRVCELDHAEQRAAVTDVGAALAIPASGLAERYAAAGDDNSREDL